MLEDQEQKIARPRQIYLGYRTREYLPLEQRTAESKSSANA